MIKNTTTKCPACNSTAPFRNDGSCVDCRTTPETMAALNGQSKEPKTMNTKNKPTHTPGPWNADSGPFIQAEDGAIVARLWTLDSGSHAAEVTGQPDEDSEIGANARLIAAAPDLLEALKAAQAHVCSSFECGEDRTACPVRGYIRAAIAKAEGR
jgi:hypothetical protein